MAARNLVVICCAGAVLAGCGGRNVAPLPNVTESVPERAAHVQTKANLTILVDIPRGIRSPRYISPGAQGMTVSLKGPEKLREAFGLTRASDRHCRFSAGVTSCTFTLQLSVGTYTTDVALFSQPPANGKIPTTAKLLSIATHVPLTMKSGRANRLKFTPAGVVASLTISGIPAGTAGTAFASSQAFTITAKDADDYVIVGPYENAVTVTDRDTTGATTIVTSGRDRPPAGELLGSSDIAALTYTGFAILPVTITASAGGAKNDTGMFTPALQPIGPASLAGGVPINAYHAASPVTFRASEPGWTNSPYDRPLSATLSNACSTFVTLTPANGTTFTAELIASAVNGTCTLTLADGLGQRLVIPLGYELFSYTGSAQSTAIPSGVTQILVTAAGAQGGAGATFAGGNGGSAIANIPVSPGTLTIDVGQAGSGGGAPPVTFGGGGAGGLSSTCCVYAGGSGGGASDVLQGGSTLLVAGGGGGGSANSGYGGAGGQVGAPGIGNGQDGNGFGGGGGTAKAGGAGGAPGVIPYEGTCAACTAGANGMLGIGGDGGSGGTTYWGGGGGGGGYYGGGGGGGAPGPGGGGGGSSFAESEATSVTYGTGTQTGNGQVTISW